MISTNGRTAAHPIDLMFLDRWSPRAFTGEAIEEAELLTMLEAARWAPSSYNAQPWRFVYARRETAHWETLLGLLVPANQIWAKDASALVFFVAKTTFAPPGSEEEVPNRVHAFDTGAASSYFVIQAHRMGWATHGMGGFDRERARVELHVPDGFEVQAAYAVGRLGDPAQLPEALREREKPSGRVPLDQLAFEGTLPD